MINKILKGDIIVMSERNSTVVYDKRGSGYKWVSLPQTVVVICNWRNKFEVAKPQRKVNYFEFKTYFILHI